jgi:hypothetical protein
VWLAALSTAATRGVPITAERLPRARQIDAPHRCTTELRASVCETDRQVSMSTGRRSRTQRRFGGDQVVEVDA